MKTTNSVKQNAFANFIGFAYVSIVGVFIFPLYLQYLGAEAFGLVGFFTALQAWMQLLDMGMSPLLSRQAAHARGQDVGYMEFEKLLRSLEFIFFILALLVLISTTASSNWIVNTWLNITSLASSKVEVCIMLMGAIIAVRFFSTLYRSGIQGMENQVQLNVVNIVSVTLKFVGALLLLQFVTHDYVDFFVYQLIIGCVELIALATMCYQLIPSIDRVGIRFFWSTLKPVLPFAAGVAYAAGAWVILTQLDKMILSTILPLSEYGYFSLVAVVATGILTISGPISQAILPRMTRLLSQGKEQDMLALYRKSTQLMAVIMLPLTGVIAMFSTELLFAWTGDRKAAEWAGPILFWFALGNGVLAMSAFQYYLQYAHGKLKMHVIYNSISVIIQIPLIIYVAFGYGALGVSIAWFSLRLIAFIIWTPIVHHKFAPGIHWHWLLADVMPSLSVTAIFLEFVDSIDFGFDTMGRFELLASLVSVGLVILTANALVSNDSRNMIMSIVKRFLVKFAGEEH